MPHYHAQRPRCSKLPDLRDESALADEQEFMQNWSFCVPLLCCSAPYIDLK
jgi:hypothetical protein